LQHEPRGLHDARARGGVDALRGAHVRGLHQVRGGLRGDGRRPDRLIVSRPSGLCAVGDSVGRAVLEAVGPARPPTVIAGRARDSGSPTRPPSRRGSQACLSRTWFHWSIPTREVRMALRKRTVALLVAGFALVGGGGGAFAATHGGSASKTPAAPSKGATANPSAPMSADHPCPNMGNGMSQTSGV